MKKSTKGLLITGAVLVFVGILLFAVAMSIIDWDFGDLATEKTVNKTHNVKNLFSSISIDVDTADVILLPSDDYSCRVETSETEYVSFAVNVQGGALTVKENDTHKWFEYIGINTTKLEIYVYLPSDDYSSLSVETDTGDVCVDKLSFDSVEISTDTGDVEFGSCNVNSLKIESGTGKLDIKDLESVSFVEIETDTGELYLTQISSSRASIESDTGEIFLSKIEVQSLSAESNTGEINFADCEIEKLNLETDTGNVVFNSYNGGEMLIETNTGDVTGTLLSEKVFIVKTNTGRIDVPESVTGEKCKITTDTGDVKLKIK